MYKITLLTIVLLFTITSFAQNKEVPQYDSTLAKKLGADEYGMKKYVMAFLKRGPNKITDKEKKDEMQKAHLKNIMRLADEGKLIIAGPFLEDSTIRGIFIFNVESVEEAKMLTDSDPGIKAGIFTVELHPWYGSAALVETMKIHKTIEKKSVAD